ncbi:Gfo/Idh/MocA family oxidoreductase [Reinekea blandensis]|uniref:Predicted dehydrogenase n=1 Tax=Reinekea blandensis MED297 TaxID=314283 RepID=A4BEG0_9GAMM|nr:Gfo/Idh/MocA family oxidoreductase [Reinekea blandensis]EAR09387.1 predicted dehydrogenase [Reinekea sp. MED297] [Reinekea blandensis MED297]
MIRTAIIGCGFSATTFHIPFITVDPSYQMTHLVSGKGSALQEDYPGVEVVADWQQLDCREIDLVIITTPNHLHYEQCQHFLQQGCHVVCEKPFVLSSNEAIALKQLAEQAGRVLCVFQNRRWDGDFLTLQSLLHSHRVGEPKRLVSRFDRFRPQVRQRWREQAVPGAGILWDLGPHLIDQALVLFGLPDSIEASARIQREGAVVVDNFDIWMHYPDVEVALGSSSFQAGPNSRFLLQGTEGSYIKNGLDVQEDALKKGVDIRDDRWGQEPEDNWGILYQENTSHLITTKPGNYGVFWHQLAQAIENDGESPVSLDDSIRVIQVLELALKSSESGQRLPVKFD